MAQPWPSPVGRFTEGLVGGLQLAQQRQQISQRQKAQELDDALKAMQISSGVIGNKHIPQQVRSASMQNFSSAMNRAMSMIDPNYKPVAFDNKLEDTDIDYATRFGKLIDLHKEGKIDEKLFVDSSKAIMSEIYGQNEPTEAKKIIESQVSPAIEQGIVAGPDMRTDTPLMQALRGIAPERAGKLGQELESKYGKELYSAYVSPTVEKGTKPYVLEELARINPELAQKQEREEGVSKRLDVERQRTEELRFKDVYRAAQQEQVVKDYRNIQTVPDRISRAKTLYDKTGEAGVLDDAILYALNKMNDPNSVVMIGEYMRTAGLQSWWDSVEGKIGKLTKSNAGISPKFRMQLYDAVTQAIGDKAKAYDERMSYFREWGSDFERNPERIKKAFPLSTEIYGVKTKQEQKTTPGKNLIWNPSKMRFE